MKTKLLAAGLLFATTAAPLSSAHAIGIMGDASGLAAPEVVLTFNGAPIANGAAVTNQFAASGVTFSPNLLYELNLPNAVPNIDADHLRNFFPVVNPFSIQFSVEVSEAAFAMLTNPGNSTFTSLLNGVVVESFIAPTTIADPNNFFGFRNSRFDEIRVDVGGPGNVMRLDNLQFTTAVPEPGALALFGLGLAGLGFAARRTRRAVGEAAS